MPDDSKPQEDYTPKSYTSKLFTPKYIFTYLIFAVIAYGLVYYFFFASKGSYNSNTGNYPATAPVTTPPVKKPAKPLTAADKTLTISLAAENGYGESGTATLIEANGQTKVTLSLVGIPGAVSQPAHIHLGSCPNPGDVKYPLTNVLSGKSETILNLTLADLRSQLPLAVNVHKSTSQPSVYVSCGNLK